MKNIICKILLLCMLVTSYGVTGCTNPEEEELKIDKIMYLAVLPFKTNGYYIAFELENSDIDATLIKRIKSIKNINDLNKNEDTYILINSIEQFDSIYREGNDAPYFILVKRFVKQKGMYKYILSDYFNENNFA